MTPRQLVLIETLETRTKASALLEVLEQARGVCEGYLAENRRLDVVKSITGRSSIESALVNTRRMVDTLDRVLEEAIKGLNEEADRSHDDAAQPVCLQDVEPMAPIAGSQWEPETGSCTPATELAVAAASARSWALT